MQRAKPRDTALRSQPASVHAACVGCDQSACGQSSVRQRARSVAALSSLPAWPWGTKRAVVDLQSRVVTTQFGVGVVTSSSEIACEIFAGKVGDSISWGHRLTRLREIFVGKVGDLIS